MNRTLQSQKSSRSADKIEQIKDEYIRKVAEFSKNQYQYIAIQVINDVIKGNNTHIGNITLIRKRLDQTLDILFDLRQSLNKTKQHDWDENKKIETFFKEFNWDNCVSSGADWPENDIDIIALNEIISKYLSIKWLNSPIMEWYMINGYLTNVISVNRDKDTSLWRVLFDKKKYRYVMISLIFKIIKSIFFYIVLPAIMIFSFTEHHYIIAYCVLLFLLLHCIRYIIKIYSKIEQKRRLLRLIDIKNHAVNYVWSPEELIKKARRISQDFFTPELLPLLSKIAKRNSGIFVLRDNRYN